MHGRTAAGQINGKGNALAAIAAGNGTGAGAGGGGGVGLGGRTEDIAELNKLICDRMWDHEQVMFKMEKTRRNCPVFLIFFCCSWFAVGTCIARVSSLAATPVVRLFFSFPVLV